MKLYRAVISAKSSVLSPLQSDTLFGAFCWNYRAIKGEKALTELIGGFRGDRPPVIFSNAFPHDALPLPFGIRDPGADMRKEAAQEEKLASYKRGKKLKNARYVSIGAFNRILQGNCQGITEEMAESGETTVQNLKNSVNRETGTVGSDEGGDLYSKEEIFHAPGSLLDVYVKTGLDEAILRETLGIMFALGIGADKSTGKGAFDMREVAGFTGFDEPEAPNGFISLSNFIPKAKDPVRGYYRVFAKYGKLDREYANSPTPFKKPLLFLRCGSAFYDEAPKEWYGRGVFGVSAVSPDIMVNGCCIPVRAKLPG
jgi:CRISPR-associated protein Csm4